MNGRIIIDISRETEFSEEQRQAMIAALEFLFGARQDLPGEMAVTIAGAFGWTLERLDIRTGLPGRPQNSEARDYIDPADGSMRTRSDLFGNWEPDAFEKHDKEHLKKMPEVYGPYSGEETLFSYPRGSLSFDREPGIGDDYDATYAAAHPTHTKRPKRDPYDHEVDAKELLKPKRPGE